VLCAHPDNAIAQHASPAEINRIPNVFIASLAAGENSRNFLGRKTLHSPSGSQP
jgi:hypothetical protein